MPTEDVETEEKGEKTIALSLIVGCVKTMDGSKVSHQISQIIANGSHKGDGGVLGASI